MAYCCCSFIQPAEEIIKKRNGSSVIGIVFSRLPSPAAAEAHAPPQLFSRRSSFWILPDHRDLYIDRSYGWTAEDEVSASPREFRFLTNCADYRTASDRLQTVLAPYSATYQKD